jgi:hypothetical protein
MLDETASIAPRPTRRISPVARALRPVQLRIGVLQERVAFLVARNLRALRQPGDRVDQAEVALKRHELAEARAELDATVADMPEKLRADGRIGDTRAALARLEHALDMLGE